MHIRAHGVIVFTTTLSVTFRSNYAQFATASLLLGTSCCASNTHQRPIKVPRKSYFVLNIRHAIAVYNIAVLVVNPSSVISRLMT